MPIPLLVPAGVAVLALLAASSKGKSAARASTTALDSPTDAQLQRATDVATTGLAPWVGYSGKNWQSESAQALATKDPAKIAEVAANMRLDGLVSQSDEMDRYAGTLTAKAAIVNSAIAQTSAILAGKADAQAYQAKVSASVPAPKPVEQNDEPRVSVPAALTTAARDYANYIRGKRKGSENKTTVMGYQKKLGMAADGLYGAGDAVAMAAADVAPPPILYWPKNLSQGPDALAKAQTAIAVAKANRGSKTSQSDWQQSYDAQAKSFRALYGVNAKPRKPAASDIVAVTVIKMAPELQAAMGELLGQSRVAGEIGWFGSKIAKAVGKAVKSTAKTAVRAVTKPAATIKSAVKTVKNAPKTVSKAVKTAGQIGKIVAQQAGKVANSPYVKVAAGGLAILCPPAGAAAVAAIAATSIASKAVGTASRAANTVSKLAPKTAAKPAAKKATATQAAASAAVHMAVLSGKTVDALHTGTPQAKAAAKKLITNTYQVAKKPGPDQAGAIRGLQALKVAAVTRSNAITVAKASKPAPSVSMAGVLVSDSGKIIKGSYRAA